MSLDQLYPPDGTVGVIISIVTEAAGGGTTVDELVERIALAAAHRPDLQLKLQTVVTQTLGSDWRLGGRARFDLLQAAASCAIFSCADVPRIALADVPAGVSHISFEVSLDETTPLELSAIETVGGLVRAALPQS
jgi:hypothetical protein